MTAEAVGPKVLAVRGLTTGFRVDGVWKDVVEDLCFEIGSRETVAIVGESGSGKSVTALSIMRLLPAANSRVSGTIELEGRPLQDLSEDAMRHLRGDRIAMIFQEPMTSLNPVFPVGMQIAEALVLHRGLGPEAAAITVLLTGLAELFYHWNVRTPHWLGPFFQRPEMHCVHHQEGLHHYNYADLPLWDLLFGTYHNPRGFDARCGFGDEAEHRIGAMLGGRDVSAPAAEGSR